VEQPLHWTYVPISPASDLEQGDIVMPTARLKGVLAEVHPHFTDDKYVGFVVATQSCDLVRRYGGEAKARYVSIAAVRSLTAVLPTLLAEAVPSVGPGLFPESSREEAKRFLKRLFDQNEQAMGLFYLHPHAEVKLGEPAVAYLRVKVALKAEHYDILVEARSGRLSAEFRGKFGWLLGNLYSRAASKDWADDPGGKEQLAQLISEYLEEKLPGTGPAWLEDELVQTGKANNVDFGAMSHTALRVALEALRPKPRLVQAIDAVIKDAQRALKAMRMETQEDDPMGASMAFYDDEFLDRLKKRLIQNGTLIKLVK
jgi:hypothetical protein